MMGDIIAVVDPADRRISHIYLRLLMLKASLIDAKAKAFTYA